MRLLKKVVLSVFIGFIVVVLALGFVFFNLKSNSIYYAQRTPHKVGVEPVLMEVTRNLDWIYAPDIKGIKYDYDGSRAIYNKNYQDGTKLAIFACSSDPSYLYWREYGSKKFVVYAFDDRFTLLRATDREKGKIPLKDIDRAELIREIYKAVQPVIDAQPEPLINLQWIYNWVNKDRFN